MFILANFCPKIPYLQTKKLLKMPKVCPNCASWCSNQECHSICADTVLTHYVQTKSFPGQKFKKNAQASLGNGTKTLYNFVSGTEYEFLLESHRYFLFASWGQIWAKFYQTWQFSFKNYVQCLKLFWKYGLNWLSKLISTFLAFWTKVDQILTIKKSKLAIMHETFQVDDIL